MPRISDYITYVTRGCTHLSLPLSKMKYIGKWCHWCLTRHASHIWWALQHWEAMRSYVKLQKLSWYKTVFLSRQVWHLLSRLQNWICPKTGQYKTCVVSNTKIEASIRATKPWQTPLTSETVEIFIQNEKAGLVSMQSRFWCGRFRVGAKPVLVR